MLTIAIPTYNRNKILRRNLELLLPQITTECNLLIIDNNSDESIENTVHDLLIKYDYLKIKIIKNYVNVGLTGNLVKCFELCDDDWLWILGDDDKVTDNSINLILKDISQNSDANFISYAWDDPSKKRKKNIIANNLDQLIDAMESIGVILFISSSIYNAKKVKEYLSYGNFFQTSYAPHLAMLFMSLKDNGVSLLMKDQIVINDSINTPSDLRWDQIFIYQLVLLLRLPLRSSTLFKIRQRLSELTKLWTIEHFIYTLTFMNRDSDGNSPLVLYEDIVRSFFYLDRRMSTKLKIVVGYIIVKHPKIFKRPLLLIHKIVKGREYKANNNLRI